jgi:hypothetical protein
VADRLRFDEVYSDEMTPGTTHRWRGERGSLMNQQSPLVLASCGYCGGETRTMNSTRWVMGEPPDGLPLVKRVCLACTGRGWYLPQWAGGEFFERVGRFRRDDRPCDFDGCGRPRRNRYCVGHDKQRQRYGESGLTPLFDRESPEYREYMAKRNRERRRA